MMVFYFKYITSSTWVMENGTPISVLFLNFYFISVKFKLLSSIGTPPSKIYLTTPFQPTPLAAAGVADSLSPSKPRLLRKSIIL